MAEAEGVPVEQLTRGLAGQADSRGDNFSFGQGSWVDPIPDFVSFEEMPPEFWELVQGRPGEDFEWAWNLTNFGFELFDRAETILGENWGLAMTYTVRNFRERLRETEHPPLETPETAQVASGEEENGEENIFAGENLSGDVGDELGESSLGAQGEGQDREIPRNPEGQGLTGATQVEEEDPQLERDASEMRRGPQGGGEDPFRVVVIKPYSIPIRPGRGELTDSSMRRLYQFWGRQVAYWHGRVPYGGVEVTQDGIMVDGEEYWFLARQGDSILWTWDPEDPWIGGYVDPRRIQWYREAGLFLEEDFDEWPTPPEHFLDF